MCYLGSNGSSKGCATTRHYQIYAMHRWSYFLRRLPRICPASFIKTIKYQLTSIGILMLPDKCVTLQDEFPSISWKITPQRVGLGTTPPSHAQHLWAKRIATFGARSCNYKQIEHWAFRSFQGDNSGQLHAFRSFHSNGTLITHGLKQILPYFEWSPP